LARARPLTVRQAETRRATPCFFGLYRAADEVEPYLAAAGVTLSVTPTTTTKDSPAVVAETSEVTITAGVSATADLETPDEIAAL